MKNWIAALAVGMSFGSAQGAAPVPVHGEPAKVPAAAANLPVVQADIEKSDDTNAPKLTQEQYEEGDRDGCMKGEVEVSATSTHPPEGKARYDVSNLDDLKLKTAWVEGAAGPGIGEAITFRLMRSYKSAQEISDLKGGSPDERELMVFTNAFAVVNGYAASPEIWKKNLRVKTLKMFFNGKPVALVHLQDTPAVQGFSVQNQVGREKMNKGDTFRFEIVDVYREGAKFEDTALSELYPGCHVIH